MSLERAGIIGAGLIGASMASALHQAGVHVRAHDQRPEHLEVCLERGFVDDACASIEEAVQDVDVVVLAVPVRAIESLLPRVDAATADRAVLMDTGSVKQPIVDVMNTLPGASRCVGGHPIAGREKAGPRYATASLFQHKPFVLCRAMATTPRALRTTRAVVRAVGGVAHEMTPARHDEVLAATSHVPQLVATALALGLRPGEVALGGTGLRDMTRLAASDPSLWHDVFSSNRRAVLDALDRFCTELSRTRDVLERDDGEALTRLFAEAEKRVRPIHPDPES